MQPSSQNTQKRSALRIVREAELLGGQLVAYHTREALVLEASFLRQDIPYFTELLAEVISQTKYTSESTRVISRRNGLGTHAHWCFLAYEFHEDVERVLHLKQAKVGSDVAALALDSAHAVAFHTGLGAPLYPSPSTPLKGYLEENAIASYAESVFSKSNIALVGDGATTAALSKWTEQFFKNVPAGSSTLNSKATTYYGGEQRTAHTGGNSLVLAFPGSSFGSFKPEIAVLAALLGGQSSVKWSPGFTLLSKTSAATPGAAASATNLAYSDAGLFTIQVSGAAAAVRLAANEAVKALKGIAEGTVSKEDLTKAIAKARFDALVSSESGISTILSAGSGIVHSGKPFQIAETVKSLEGVTADKLKTVRTCSNTHDPELAANEYNRLPRRLLKERLLLLPLVICMLYPTRRSLVLRYRLGKRTEVYQHQFSSLLWSRE
jgi:ubiquinol-cytochrome c reductase core subunit 2